MKRFTNNPIRMLLAAHRYIKSTDYELKAADKFSVLPCFMAETLYCAGHAIRATWTSYTVMSRYDEMHTRLLTFASVWISKEINTDNNSFASYLSSIRYGVNPAVSSIVGGAHNLELLMDVTAGLRINNDYFTSVLEALVIVGDIDKFTFREKLKRAKMLDNLFHYGILSIDHPYGIITPLSIRNSNASHVMKNMVLMYNKTESWKQCQKQTKVI